MSPAGWYRPSEMKPVPPPDSSAITCALSTSGVRCGGSPSPLGPGRTRPRSGCGDVLAGQPAELIELVHAHVDRRCRRCAPGTRPTAAPRPTGSRSPGGRRPAHRAAIRSRSAPQRGHVPPPVGDLERHARRRGGLGRGTGLRGGQPARLLAQDRQAARGDLGDDLAGAGRSARRSAPRRRRRGPASPRCPGTPPTPGAATARRASADTSAMAVTATRSEPASARRWVRPIRPAPISPSRNGAAMSQPPRGEERAVVPLFLRRPARTAPRCAAGCPARPPASRRTTMPRRPSRMASTSRSPPPSAQNASRAQISVTGASSATICRP